MATQPFQFFAAVPRLLGNKEMDFDTDTLKLTLHNTSIAPNRSTMSYWSSLAASELATGSGYTAGGIQLSGVTWQTAAATAWAIARAASTVYAQGALVRPASANGFLYVAANTGTTGSTVPTFPQTVGLSVTDGTVTWICVGIAATTLTASGGNPTWSSFSAGPFQYAVLHDHSPASDATRGLVALADLGSPQTGTGQDFQIIPDTVGYGYAAAA